MCGRRAAAVLALALVSLGTILVPPSGGSDGRVLASSLVRGPIHIVGDGNFTPANGVVGGQGTPLDPYVIAGWSITALSDPAVWIQDTRAAFVVRDVDIQCYYSSGYAMSYQNVTDGRLQNVSARKCYVSADVAGASRMSIIAANFTHASSDWAYGIQARQSDNLTLEEDNVTMTAGASLSFQGQNLTVRRSYFAGSVSIGSSRDVLIESNTFGGSAGIGVSGVSGIQLLENNFTLGGVSVWGSSGLILSRNRLGPPGLSPDCSAGACDTYTITADNLVDGRPLLSYRNVPDVILDGIPVGELILVNCTRARVWNLTFEHSGLSAIVANGNGLEVVNVSAIDGAAGSISLVDVRNVTISNVGNTALYLGEVHNVTISNVRNASLNLNEVHNATIRDVVNGSWLNADSSSNVSVEENVLFSVLFTGVANVTLRHNELTSPSGGIMISGSTNVSLLDNNLSGEGSALHVYSSSYLRLSRNRIGSGGAYLCTEASSCETYDITPDNLVNDRPLLFYRDCSDQVVGGIEVGEIILFNCTRVRLANLTYGGLSPAGSWWSSSVEIVAQKVEGLWVTNVTSPGSNIGGILLFDVHNASLSGVDGITQFSTVDSSRLSIANNSFLDAGAYYDIDFRATRDVTFSSNTVMGRLPYSGVYFRFYDGENLTVTTSSFSLAILDVAGTSNVTLDRNTLASGYVRFLSGHHYRITNNSRAPTRVCCGSSLWLGQVDDVVLYDNILRYGTAVSDSHGGVAVGNDWRAGGLQLSNATGWTLYNNSFSGPALDDRGPENRWDDGYPTGGNLWLDYKGVDKCRGPSQDDCTAGDGFGDTPYVIDANSTDRYPIMPPQVPPPPPPSPPANNLPPVALITAYPTTAIVGQDITFVGTDSYDPDGQKVFMLYRWEFGDGTTSTKEVAIHAYSLVGHYTVTLTVWDLYNATGAATVNVTIVVTEAPSAIQLIPFQVWDGYRLPLPLGWSFRFNATHGNRTYDLYLDGLYNETPVTLAVDSDVESGVQETPSYLQDFADRVLAAARSTDPEARFLADPGLRTLSNHAGVVFTVVYPRMSVFQEFAYVVSSSSSRSWLVFLSGSLDDRPYLATVFERILAGFAITLIEVAPLDLGWVLLVAGVGAAVAVPVAVLAYTRRKRPRSKVRKK